MSVPYLNRGESIVLTTHRVSVGSVPYDAMLTNQRLILMDSRSDQFEPEILPFMEIVTVKGAKASTGEPAILLTLSEPNSFTDSGQVSLIFTQNAGEKRKHERELWVKKLIELVIKARELEAHSRITPLEKKTGLQPSVRRWEAPEPVRPHSSSEEPATPTVEPVVITEQEPDSLEFFLENKVHKEQDVEQKTGETMKRALTDLAEAAPETGSVPHIPEPAISSSPKVDPRELFAGIHLTPPPREQVEDSGADLPQPEPVKPYNSREQFDDIVQTAAESLQVKEDTASDVQNPPADREQIVTKTSPLSEVLHGEHTPAIPAHQTPGEKRELPGTYSPEISVPVFIASPNEKTPVSRPPADNIIHPRRPVILIAGIAIVAAIVLVGIIGIVLIYLQGSAYSDTIITVSPSIPVRQDMPTAGPDLQQTGVRIHIVYPHLFTGTIGSPGLLRQVSGSGDQTYPVVMTTSIVQAVVQKPDNSGDPLIVEIYNNSTLLASRTVTAPMAEINLLIDTKTSIPPGMSTGTLSAEGKTMLGNGSLIYY